MIPQLLSNARAEEIITVSDDIIGVTEKSIYKEENLTETVNLLKAPKEELVKIIKRKLGSDKTRIADLFEGLRDKGLKWLFNTTYAATFSLDENIEEHANKLYEVFTRHGLSMYRLPRKEQTAVMASMFNELKLPALQESVQVVGVQPIIDKIDEVNKQYIASEEDKTHDNATREILKQQSVASKEVRDQLDHIVHYLNFLSNIKSDEAFLQLSKEINELISKANTTIRARKNRGKKSEEVAE